MDRAEYDKLDRLEDSMWWFAATHANLLTLARPFAEDAAARNRVLDAGCGTGGLLAKLAADRPQATVIGLDADQQACERAAAKSARPVCRDYSGGRFHGRAGRGVIVALAGAHAFSDGRLALGHGDWGEWSVADLVVPAQAAGIAALAGKPRTNCRSECCVGIA